MQRVAILVDGENVSANHSDRLLSIACTCGRADVAKVYGDVTKIPNWANTSQFQVIHSGTGKNATDMLLAIDAIELAQTEAFETFIIASSDGDFRHLAQRLRERGIKVVGAGEYKAPDCFRAVVSDFKLLGPDQPENRNGEVLAKNSKIAEMDQNIRKVIGSNSKNGEGMKISLLSSQMKALYDIKIGTFPEKTWRAYLNARSELYDLDPRGPEARVRFRPKGFCAGK